MKEPGEQPVRYCIGCRYPLGGLSADRCPECGDAFDPSDPRTTLPLPIAPAWFTAGSVARFLMYGAGISTGLAFLASWFGVDLLWLWLAGVLGVPFIILLILLAAIPRVRLSARSRVAAFIWITLLASIILTGWPYRIGFLIHRPTLDRFVQRIQAGELPAQSGPVRIGLLRFRQVRSEEGNIGLQFSGDDGGGIYLVHKDPGSTRVWVNTNWEQSLGGGWFRVYED